MSKKQIIITRLFEFGGSNSHLKNLIRYWGRENILLVIEDSNQLPYLENISQGQINVLVKPLHKYARLNQPSLVQKIKELRHILRSVVSVFYLSLKNNGAGITINSTEPMKLLYLLWLPFTRVCYILHTTPEKTDTWFSSFTCNRRLGRRKKIITVSEATKNQLCLSWGINEGKRQQVKVVYNCVSEPGPAAVEAVHGGPTVLTMGYVIGYKNPGTWLEVARAVTAQRDDVVFSWLGNGPLWAEFAAETSTEKRISFAGLADNPAAYLARSVIYYQPSFYETQGIAVLEAMSYGLPCVVSNAGGLPESVQDGYNGFLVEPDNACLHAGRILALLNNPELSKTYGHNGYKKYLGSFTYDAFKTRMDGIWAS